MYCALCINKEAKMAERPRGCLQSNYTPVQIRILAYYYVKQRYVKTRESFRFSPSAARTRYREAILLRQMAWEILNISKYEKVRESQAVRYRTFSFSGHSSCVTPGLIPNPAVKTTHVGICTEVRESLGTYPRCWYK